jgi:radical SAM protein (TIGR04043 family)
MRTTSLPVLQPPREARFVLTELQALGARWDGDRAPGVSRKGGAGPSDHTAVLFAGHTTMIPIHTSPAERSPYVIRALDASRGILECDGVSLGEVGFPARPRFYDYVTSDGVPAWKVAQLHGTDVLATTVRQQCVRYADPALACRFCAIGQSLAAGRTIARKTPQQLAEVAEVAVQLDGVKHMVMTTGTPGTPDRGARFLAECAAAVMAAAPLPIQAQCEPPADDDWFYVMRSSGIVSLGMHLEAVTEEVRERIMPGKAEVPVARYLRAFERAVAVFGRGQVSTYILAGLGDSADDILSMCTVLAGMGVYPFVVPFVPIRGTPLEAHAPPEPRWFRNLITRLANVVREAGLSRESIAAGCGRCGACSTLAAHEAIL